MEELSVGQVFISKQKEISQNYQKFLEIVKSRKIKVNIVKAGDKINIEKDTYFNILWPKGNLEINDNPLNNNSIVTKLVYKNFSILFTGDIEEIAEKQILEEYRNNTDILKSSVLKIAHHGSKTSSTKEFLNVVRPNYALIGVGKDNKFGHPSEITLQNLYEINCIVFRTDECGEITFKTN